MALCKPTLARQLSDEARGLLLRSLDGDARASAPEDLAEAVSVVVRVQPAAPGDELSVAKIKQSLER